MSKKKKERQYTLPCCALMSVLTAIAIYAIAALIIALAVSRGGEMLRYAHYLAAASAGMSCFVAVVINGRRHRGKSAYATFITVGCCIGLIAIMYLLNSNGASFCAGWHSMMMIVCGGLLALAFTKRIKRRRSRK